MGGYGSSYSYSSSSNVVKTSVHDYNISHSRSYTPIEEKKAIPPPMGKEIQTSTKFPLVISVDVTGSMRHFPKLIFEKLCILYNEALYFLPNKIKKSFEISFSAIGDAYCDRYPIQVTDFGKESELDANIDSLFPEGGGGGQTNETYELMAYYYLNHCSIKKKTKIKPLFIFIGDEGYYPKVNKNQIRNYIGDDLSFDVNSKKIFKKLMKKFDVYILRVEYSGSQKYESKINKQWIEALGQERVLLMKDPKRVVDIILGIIANKVNGFKHFKERIELRQTKDQVDIVYSELDNLNMTKEKKEPFKCKECGSKIKKSENFDHCPYCGVKLNKE